MFIIADMQLSRTNKLSGHLYTTYARSVLNLAPVLNPHLNCIKTQLVTTQRFATRLVTELRGMNYKETS